MDDKEKTVKVRIKVRINVYDIVGQCLGKYEVVGYQGMRYSYTKGGPRLRHWYKCRYKCINSDGYDKVVQRGQLLAQRGGQPEIWL